MLVMWDVGSGSVTGIPKSNETPAKEEWWQEQLEKNRALAAILESWIQEGDEEEQRETWEFLRKALDEDRLSDRKLFPDNQ